MKPILRICLVVVALVGLVRAVQEAREPGYEVHITGDDAVRAARAMADDGECREAVPVLERAIAKPLLSVEPAGAFETLGRCYLEIGTDDGGESTAGRGHAYQGLAHRLRGEDDLARAAFERAVAVQPDLALGHESLGALELISGRNREALPHLERAIALDPANATTRSNLALAYSRLHRFRDADREVEQAARLGFRDVEKLRRLVAEARAAAGGASG